MKSTIDYSTMKSIEEFGIIHNPISKSVFPDEYVVERTWYYGPERLAGPVGKWL